ncbi:MAG: hypothetical protein MAG795_00976 [Candidatus Woesearchaeota archaeon]|nr:hypothetical protein [Candidatus Woesearchaeota archaeon]
MKSLEEKFHGRLEQRESAFHNGEALGYAVLCDLCDVEPGMKFGEEGTALYNEGREHGYYDYLLEEYLEEDIKHARILNFVNIGGGYNRNQFEQTDSKRTLLVKSFPKFRPDGAQDISDYTPVKVGHLFLNVLDSYLED